MNYYRVLLVKYGHMNRSAKFKDWDGCKEYIEKAFERKSSLIVVVRPDDTVALLFSPDMKIGERSRVGPYTNYELSPAAAKSYAELVKAEGELEEQELELDNYALATA